MLSESDIRATIEMLENAIGARWEVDMPTGGDGLMQAWDHVRQTLHWVLEHECDDAYLIESLMEDAREELGIHPQGL